MPLEENLKDGQLTIQRKEDESKSRQEGHKNEKTTTESNKLSFVSGVHCQDDRNCFVLGSKGREAPNSAQIHPGSSGGLERKGDRGRISTPRS